MAVRANKPAFNIREKLKELTHSIGLKGHELMRAATVQEARELVSVSNGRKNILYNGDFKIAQRDAGTQSGTAVGYLTVDRWYIYNSANGSNITHGRDSDVPDEGYSYSYKFDTTGGSPPTANGNFIMLRQYIEVSDVKRLAFGTPKAKSLTMSFWFKSNHSGTITWNQMIQNSATQRQISRQVQVHGDGAWHKYEMTIPGDSAGGAIQSDATGNPENYSGLYLDLIFWMSTAWTNGSRFNDTWQNNVSNERAVGHINLLTGANQYIKITGIQLEVGKNATEFEHRSYGEELALCQRYYYRHATGTTGSGGSQPICNALYYSTANAFGVVTFPTTMRDVADLDQNAAVTGFQILRAGTHEDIVTFSVQERSNAGFTIECSGLSGTIGHAAWFRTTSDSVASVPYLGFDAEL